MDKPGADGQLYIRFLREGDEEALRTLFLKHKDSLTFFLYGIVRDAEDAEELMMDTFALLASGTAHYSIRKDAEFKTWLYAVARNQARMFLRRHREIPSEIWEDAEPMAEMGSFGNSPEQAMLADERNTKLWKVMQSLHPDYAQVLYLTYFENMTPSEIGRVMKKSEKQVYNLSARAKVSLKGKLEGTKYSWDI
ncbi:MAG: sigma-70 family RNA polymerase sigma factor [Lachnospiraceae bacterium]|nr:sigma-70 family RNA polymerase sigma factor [Lachnospiraceae bacterium]